MKYLLDGEESNRLLFRKVNKNDFETWLEFYKNPASSMYWIADYQEPKVECEKWYDKQFFRYENNLGGMNALVDKSTNQLVGHCGLLVQTVDGKHELEIGYSLLPKFWHNGFATEAAHKCRDFAFANDLSKNLISIISLSNVPSQNVARKNGMKIVNTTEYNLNEVYIYQISKIEWSALKNV